MSIQGKPHVLIIGGGISGLSSAIGLMKRGFEVSVYEKAKELREIGSGVVMAPNGMKAAFALDKAVGESLASHFGQAGDAKTHFRVMTIKDRTISSALDEFSTQKNHFHRKFCLHRTTIQKMLLDMLPKDCIHTKKKAVRFEETTSKVTVFFEDGTQATGDLLVGCDGWHSMVREHFHPSARRLYLGATSVRSIAKLKDFKYKNGCIILDRHNDYILITVPLHDKPDYFYVSSAFKAPEGLWPAKSKETLKSSLLEKMGPAKNLAREIVELSEEDNQYAADLSCMEPMPNWSTARITMAGDAAHPISPVVGQGINTAIEDAAVPSKMLEQHHQSPEVAFKLYQENRIPRTAKVMTLGYKFTDRMVLSVPMERWTHPLLKHFGNARGLLRIYAGAITSIRLSKLLNDYKI